MSNYLIKRELMLGGVTSLNGVRGTNKSPWTNYIKVFSPIIYEIS